MAIRPLLTYPHPSLQVIASEVPEILTDAHHQASQDLIDTLVSLEQAGALAANQVGIHWRMVAFNPVVELPYGQPGQTKVGINPEIVDHEGEILSTEGCLSFPDVTVQVPRYRDIVVRMRDATGQSHTFELKGGTYSVRNLQHELDHLNGITFFDRLSPTKRKIVEKKYLKRQQKRLLSS